jgi:hypothetical protein
VKVIGELIETIARGAGLKNVREVGERLTKSDRGPSGGRAGVLAEKLLDVVGSDLLDYGQSVITGMKSTTGQGDPENGGVFGEAQSTFYGVNETLKSAVPDDGWDGSGSYAYADQNTRQQLRSEAMADADHEVHKVLDREAAQITVRRGYLDDQYNFLANTSYVTFPLQFIPRYGEAMKLAIEIGALQTALGESYHQMNRLQSEVAQNAAELQQAVDRYSGVADGAELPGAAVHFDPPPPPPGGIGPPPLPQVPPLGSLLSPVAGFVTGAAPAAGQLAAASAQRRAKKGRPRDEESTDHEDKADKDPTEAASGDGESERAPVHAERDPNSERLHTPVAARLDADNSPGPPAGTPPRDRSRR